MGTVFGERAHPEDRGTLIGVCEDLLSRKRNFASVEVRVRHKDGEWRRLRCHLSPLFEEKGKIEGLVISGRDITEVKRLEEQLIQAEKLANQLAGPPRRAHRAEPSGVLPSRLSAEEAAGLECSD